MIKRSRRRRADSKYRPKYARELREGLRAEGMTVAECCVHWNIRYSDYQNWKKAEPEFSYAHELAEMQFQAFWDRTFREGATGLKEVNAGLMKVAAAHFNGYTTEKTETNNHNEEIRVIRIEGLPSPKRIRTIEHKEEHVGICHTLDRESEEVSSS